MKKKLLFITCLISVSALRAQVTVTPANTTQCAGEIQQLTASGGGGSGTSMLFFENFESGTLGNFTVTGSATANSEWTNRTSPYTSPSSVWQPTINSGSKFALSNSDYSGAVVNTSLESGVLNTTGYTSLTLTYRQYYSDYSATNDFAYVEVSINGGTDWTTVQTYSTTQGSGSSFANATVSFNDYLNQPNFKFRLRYVATWNDGWALDDVVVSGVSTTVATYTWSPQDGLYTDAAATMPYTGTETSTVYAKPAETTTYTASYTNGSDTFSGESLITVTVTEAPFFGDDSPILCHEIALDGIAPPDTDIIWYSSATGDEQLPGSTVVSDGTYYAAQVANGCESIDRTPVNVTINHVEPPTGDAVQSFCNAGTVGDLEAEGATFWYDAPTGGNMLPMNTPLENLEMYYASRSADGCESTERFAVEAIISFAAVETSEDVSACDSYTLPELEYGHYFTESGGNGEMIEEGSAISETTLLYIYADDFSNPECTAETWFTIYIHTAGQLSGEQEQTIEADTAEDATVADLVVTSDGGGFILWYLTFEDAQNGVNPVSIEAPLIDGHEYFATLTIGDCTSAPYGVTANVLLGNNSFDLNSLTYSPNPVKDILTVSYPSGITAVSISNMLGQQVILQKPNAPEARVDMSGLAGGTYIMSVTSGDNVKTMKIVKE